MPFSTDPPLTPLFPVEPHEEKKEVLSPKKEKSPSELHSGSMTPPHSYLNENQTIYWRPNNYRRQIEVKPRNLRVEAFIKSTLGGTPPHSQNKIVSLRYQGITIQYHKKTVQGIYKQNMIWGHKEIFEFHGTVQENEKKINSKREEIRERIDNALMSFIKKCKIGIPLKKPIWTRHEDFIKGESFVDSIPKEVIIHDTTFKKVYGRGIEFIGTKKGDVPTHGLKTYIKNRAIEDIAPEIAESIRQVTAEIGLIQDVDKLKKVTLALIDAFINYIDRKL